MPVEHYDYLIVGAGLFGAVVADRLTAAGKSCLVIDRRNHVGGNVYTEQIRGITVHKYGAHIFHTNHKEVWDYMNLFAEFNRYTNSPVANYKGELYNLPFNMNTFYRMWGTRTPEEAWREIERQRRECGISHPRNLEEQAILLVGRDIYEKLIKGYTEKQWGKKAVELPAFIIRRLPVRFTFDNNYFDDRYQGIPVGGYTPVVKRMLERCDTVLGADYLADKARWDRKAGRVVYTGEIDRYYGYCYGALEYRSLRFDTEVLEGCANWQGNAVVNYTDAETPYTRIIEHKHFEYGRQPDTVITREYPVSFQPGREPYYPVNDDKNALLYDRYRQLAAKEKRVFFGGRLAEYRYYNMDQVVKRALDFASSQI